MYITNINSYFNIQRSIFPFAISALRTLLQPCPRHRLAPYRSRPRVRCPRCQRSRRRPRRMPRGATARHRWSRCARFCWEDPMRLGCWMWFGGWIFCNFKMLNVRYVEMMKWLRHRPCMVYQWNLLDWCRLMVVLKLLERNYLEQWWFLEVQYGLLMSNCSISNVRKKPLLDVSNNASFNHINRQDHAERCLSW